MPEANFYLKKANPNTGKSLIYLQLKYSKKKLVFAFNQTIEASNWNSKKQRVKVNSITTTDGKYYLNDLLDKLENVCQSAYNKECSNGIPVPSVIRDYLVDFIKYNVNQEERKLGMPTIFELIERFISGDIKYLGRERSANTRKNYTTAKGHLTNFQKETKFPVSFDTITLDFFYSYCSFLKKKGLGPNSIAKNIKLVKVFMNEGVDLGYTENIAFRHRKFSMPEVQTDATFLTEDEIMKLYKLDLSLNSKFERVRDLFVFGCFVGLRYSDYSNIKPENIITIESEYFLKVITTKTKEMVIIPCNPVVREIFHKYRNNHNSLPQSISEQKFNQYIKEICQLAGGCFFDKGRITTNPDKELWKCVSTHTARRSFASNYFIQGFPTIDLMKVTGHRTESSFLTYIKLSKLDSAKRLSQHIKKNWNHNLLSVAV